MLMGSGFPFAATIQPGPLQAFLLSSVARIGWRRTLLALLVLNRMPEALGAALQAAGLMRAGAMQT